MNASIFDAQLKEGRIKAINTKPRNNALQILL
jgi:hypothetical protein